MTWRRAALAAVALTAFAVAAQAWIAWRDASHVPAGRIALPYPHVPTDHYAYAMVTEQARAGGGLLHRNLFTTAPQDGRFLMLGLTATGWLSELLGLEDGAAWHGLRLLFMVLLAAVLWLLCRRLWPASPPRALSGFAAVLLAGGLDFAIRRAVLAGWVEAPAPDWWGENPWNYSVFWTCSLATWTLPLAGFIALVLAEVGRPVPPGGSPARSIVRGLGFAALWSVHPYSAIGYGFLAAGATVMDIARAGPSGPWRRLAAAAPAAAGVAAVAAWIAWSGEDQVAAASSGQVFSWKAMTPWYLYPVAYGPLSLLSLAGLGRDSPGERGFAFVTGWLLAALACSFNPFVTAAKFQFLVTVPLVLLAVRGAWRLLDRLAPRTGGRWMAIGVAFASAGVVDGVVSDWRDEETRLAASASPELLAALDDLRVLPEGGVLCDPTDGMLVPWKARKPVFVGHWFLSTRFYEKADLVRWFFAGPATPAQREGFLREAGIRYILYGPRERRLGPMPLVPGLVRRGGPEDHQVWEWTRDSPTGVRSCRLSSGFGGAHTQLGSPVAPG